MSHFNQQCAPFSGCTLLPSAERPHVHLKKCGCAGIPRKHVRLKACADDRFGRSLLLLCFVYKPCCWFRLLWIAVVIFVNSSVVRDTFSEWPFFWLLNPKSPACPF